MRVIKAFWLFRFVMQGEDHNGWFVPYISVPGWHTYRAARKQARWLMKRSVKRRGGDRYIIVHVQYLPVPWGINNDYKMDLRRIITDNSLKDVALETPGFVERV